MKTTPWEVICVMWMLFLLPYQMFLRPEKFKGSGIAAALGEFMALGGAVFSACVQIIFVLFVCICVVVCNL